jgi:hypothetical protein
MVVQRLGASRGAGMTALGDPEFWGRLLTSLADDPVFRGSLGWEADVVDDPVSIGLAVAVGALGWWCGRSSGGRPRQAHGA